MGLDKLSLVFSSSLKKLAQSGVEMLRLAVHLPTRFLLLELATVVRLHQH